MPRNLVPQHGIQHDKQLAHGGHEGHFLGFALVAQACVEDPDGGVPAHRDQVADPDKQQAAWEAYCAAKGWQTETIRDLGSGLDYRKAGAAPSAGSDFEEADTSIGVDRQGSHAAFRGGLVFALCELQGIEVVMITATRLMWN